jgi:hypothetical protein
MNAGLCECLSGICERASRFWEVGVGIPEWVVGRRELRSRFCERVAENCKTASDKCEEESLISEMGSGFIEGGSGIHKAGSLVLEWGVGFGEMQSWLFIV